jgi:hypothetical protein
MRLAAAVNNRTAMLAPLSQFAGREAVKRIAAVAEGQQSRRRADGFNWDGEVCQWVIDGGERGAARMRRRLRVGKRMRAEKTSPHWLAAGGGVVTILSLIEGLSVHC